MKKKISAVVTGLLILWLSSFAFAQGEIARLTIYPNNMGLVEGVKVIALTEGINEITFGPVSEGIILDSVYPRAKKCRFTELRYDSDSSLSWTVDSEIEGEALLRVVYLTTGLSWKLNYILEINKENTLMKIKGQAAVENKTGMDFFQTPLTLTTGSPLSVEGLDIGETSSGPSSKVSSFSLSNISYSILPSSFKNEEKKIILLFSKENVPLTKVYLFDASKYGEEVREELWFTNEGEEELPEGRAYIYEVDSADFSEKIAPRTTLFPQVLPGEEGRIYMGQARNLEGERIFSIDSQESYEDEEGHKVVLNEYTCRIILRNSRDVPATIRVVEHFFGKLENLESDPDPYVQGKNLIVYEVEVPSQGKEEIKYTARTKVAAENTAGE